MNGASMPKETEDNGFDLEGVHDEQIFPLMAKIIEVCKEHRIPLLCSFNYADSGVHGSGLRSFCTTHQNYGRECKEFEAALDRIRGVPMALFAVRDRRKGEQRT